MIRCEGCDRFIRVAESDCPFCSAPTPASRTLGSLAGGAAVLVLSACYGVSDKYDYDTTDTGRPDTDTTESGELVVSVQWNDDGLTPLDTDGDSLPDINCDDSVDIAITDPLLETAWSFGMAETGSGNGWFGEDCFEGYANFNFCHSIGINANIPEVSSCSALDVADGATLFDAEKDPFLTYYLEDSLGNCFVWGHDTSYYGPLACVDM